MRTSNAMQLKSHINRAAKTAGIPPQAMLQNYVLERLLERLALSPWRNQVIVKGGMLISSLVGVASRTTLDLDTTVTGLALTHDSAKRIFSDIASINTEDNWSFHFDRTEEIRETDDYPGIRVHLRAQYAPMSVPLTIDVTTGDQITPKAIEYEYQLLFDDRSIHLMAYPLETILAEKLETIIARGITYTRPRDFYDVHVLWKLNENKCDLNLLHSAIEATCKHRGSVTDLTHWLSVIDDIEEDTLLFSIWTRYVKKNPYASGIDLPECCQTVREIISTLENHGSDSGRRYWRPEVI